MQKRRPGGEVDYGELLRKAKEQSVYVVRDWSLVELCRCDWSGECHAVIPIGRGRNIACMLCVSGH